MFDYIFTIGCFDRLHAGHINLLENIKSKCNKLVIGVYDNSNIKKNIQKLDIRINNLKTYSSNIFVIHDTDPTNAIKEYITNINITDNKVCFMRGDDDKNFPGFKYISSVMPITYIPYTKNISSSILRDTKHKIGIFNTLLCKVSSVLKLHNIPYYLDCGTLLGCVRNNAFIEHDKDIDINTHISMWNRLQSINFEKYNLKIYRITGNCQRFISITLPGGKLYCDIFTTLLFPKLSSKILNGVIYPIPIQSELYLEQLYKKDWRIPSSDAADAYYCRGYGLASSPYLPYLNLSFYEKNTCHRFKCNPNTLYKLIDKYNQYRTI